MSKKKTDFQKRLSWRKRQLYIILTVAFIVSLIATFFTLADEFNRITQPQISRAIVQISKMFPEIEYNDYNLHEAYEKTIEWQKWYFEKMEIPEERQSEFLMDESKYEQLTDQSLSWIKRISRIKVGHDGYVIVVSKNDGRILSHPDAGYIGQRMLILDSDNTIVPMNEARHAYSYNMMDIKSDAEPEDLKADLSFMMPESTADPVSAYSAVTAGYAVSYSDTYIIFGVSISEMVSFMSKGFSVTLISFIDVWVFIRYVSMLISRHEKSGRMIRAKLVAYVTLLSVGITIASGYVYVLSDTTLELKTLETHAQAAVETLDDFKKSRDSINKWLDERYLAQCRFIAEIMMSDKYAPEDLNRKKLQELSEIFAVKYIYVYDKNGKVVMTNSPYDNISLSSNPESQSYVFRKLLNGVEYVIQEPLTDELSGEYLQYIGMSLRDKNDLCDGFVQIAIDPALRTGLTEWLGVDTVLENLLIGLPDYAAAIDKNTMLISETTGLGFEGDSAETIGLTEEKLTGSKSGFLQIRETDYYAGFGESSDLYIVPAVLPGGAMNSFAESLKVIIIPIITLILVSFAALWHYQKNIYDAAPETAGEDEKEEEEEEKDKADDPSGNDDEDLTLFSGFSDLIRVKEKYGMNERWKAHIPRKKQTPEMRVRGIITVLLFVFCLIELVPVIYYNFDGYVSPSNMSSIEYVIRGSWDKGLNIFAVTSCIFLLCGLYLLVVVADRILYSIAQVSSTRTETVCLLLRNSLKYICSIIFIYYGLSQFGIPTQTLLASAGLLSLLITFGAKDLVSDIIAGFFIIFEGTIKVGDWISVGSWSGTVLEIGVRTTKIRYFADTKIMNNSQLRDIVNADGNVAKMNVKFIIPYSIKLEDFERILEKELPEMQKNVPGLAGPPKYQHVQSFEPNGLMLRIALYTIPYKRMRAYRVFQRELKLMFERYNIENPYNCIIAYNAAYDPPVMLTCKEDDTPEENTPENTPAENPENGQ